MDFTSNPVVISSQIVDKENDGEIKDAKPILETSKAVKARVCAVEAVMETEDEAIDNCAVPLFNKTLSPQYDMPECGIPLLSPLLDYHKSLFTTTPGHINLAEHLSEGIIEENSSPWMAPVVFVHKKTGDV